MKLIVSIMLMLIVFPVLDVSCKAFGISNTSTILAFVVYSIESIAVTGWMFFSRMVVKAKHRKLLQNVLVLVIALVFGVLCSLLLDGFSLGFCIVSSVAVGFTIKKVYTLHTETFANAYLYVITSIVYLICTFIGWQSEFAVSKATYTVMYLVFCVMFGVMLNRSNLEKVIRRRNQNLDSIPKDIFRYNTKLTILVCLLPIPLLLFSNRIGNATYGLMVSAFRGIIYVGSTISSLFAKDETPIETVETDSQVTYQPYYESNSNALWDVFTVAMVALIVYLVYRNYALLIEKFKSLFSTLKGKIAYKPLETPSTEYDTLSNGYTDHVKTIPKGYDKKAFKKDYKAYLKSPTTTETLTFGFEILVKGLNLLGYDVLPHETISEVSTHYDITQFSKGYVPIRYGATKPTQTVRSQLDTLLKDIYHKL